MTSFETTITENVFEVWEVVVFLPFLVLSLSFILD